MAHVTHFSNASPEIKIRLFLRKNPAFGWVKNKVLEIWQFLYNIVHYELCGKVTNERTSGQVNIIQQ